MLLVNLVSIYRISTVEQAEHGVWSIGIHPFNQDILYNKDSALSPMSERCGELENCWNGTFMLVLSINRHQSHHHLLSQGLMVALSAFGGQTSTISAVYIYPLPKANKGSP
jgi:hypothetical protein